uniref:Mannosyl-oligosaccharide glucosidase n=1 Tax=Salix viminalis TaxID=40686 RepID=A0A6N2N7T6_SALVM
MAPGSSRRNARSRTSSATEANDGGDNSLGNAKPRRRDRSKDQNSIRILNVDIKILLGISVLAFFVILLLIRNLIIRPAGKAQRPRVITPFPSPKLMDLPQFQGEHKESLYWGTYRPHVYFGIRARTPRSLVAGLMWIGVKDGMYHMRHVCQDSDELNTYGWTQHNGRDFGHQVLVDQGLKLTTSFLKSKSEGSGYGGDWAVQIDVQTDKPELDNEMLRHGHLFFYLADESGHVLSLAGDNLDTDKNSLLASGSRSDIGDWQLHLKSKEVLELHYSGFRTPHIHNLSDLVQHNLGAQVRKFGQLLLSDSSEDSPNILVFQISASIPFKADIAFVSGTKVKMSKVKERVSRLTGASLTSLLQDKQTEFDVKFERRFNVADKLEPESTIVGKAAIANMLGGIGYFYGQSKISIPENSSLRVHDNFISYWPAELYTAVPSRPFFPRGFLWDEGFHQLLIWRWDVHICLDIIGHWLDLMNMDGWIPREQILGSEALSKVPEEFVAQYPSNGNPPTLFLVIRGKEMGSYYWHGRDNKVTRELNPKTLSSGLDDYPRASHPSDEEQHLDLRCWMLLAANCMQSITQLLKNDKKPEKEYGSTAKLLSDFDMLNQMHLHPLVGAYYDFGNHTEKVRLSWKETRVGTRELVREVLEQPVPRFVPHIGYVSLFPFMGKIIPSDSWILGKQLDLISNSTVFWTDYGLRSLSKTSSMYMKRNTEHDPPYWRGPIWMNMNYMILSALYHYSKEDGPYSDRARVIYNDLRGNLIRNVVRNYHQTGFLWEQYDQKKGKGKGARLFTGWTSLVLLIMAEAYT